MADDLPITEVPPEVTDDGDEIGDRREYFLEQLGIPTTQIRVGLIAPSLAHALAAPVDAPPRPWAALGGRNIGGHVHSIAQDPNNPGTIFAGTAWGGVWVSRNAGDTWAPLGNPEDALPIGAIALAPSNTRMLYIGTGETITLRNSAALSVPPSGLGFFRCDTSVAVPRLIQEVVPPAAGGAGPPGSAATDSRIVVDPHNADRCWIASSSGLWRREAGPAFNLEPVPLRTAATVRHATDVAIVENWSNVPAQLGTYRIWVAFDSEGVFRGTYNPAVGGNVVWDLAGAGTFSTDAAGTAVTGVGTHFTAFFRVGDTINTSGLAPTDIATVISAIADDTHMTVAPAFAPVVPAGTNYFRVAPPASLQGLGTIAVPGPAAPAVVNGVGTNFQTTFVVGDEFRTFGLPQDFADVVSAIANNTSLTLTNVAAPAAGLAAAGTNYGNQPAGGIGLPNGPGTITSLPGSNIVTGVGTNFLAFFAVGDEIRTTPATKTTWMQLRTITAINNNTQLTVNAPFSPALAAATTYAKQTALGSGFPGFNAFGRVRLAVCKAHPEHVYALAVNNQPGQGFMLPVYHSNDGGDTWHTMNAPEVNWPGLGAAGWYSLAFAVHPFEPGILLAGGVNLYRSTNFGADWTQVLDWTQYDSGDRSQHADHHEIVWDAFDHRKVWVGNDGGVAIAPNMPDGNPSTQRGWRKRSHGILAAQFNDITVHRSYPFIMGGGLQDNGTFYSLGGPTWYHAGGGDGGEIEFELRNPRNSYVSWQNHFMNCNVVLGNTPNPGWPTFKVSSPVNPDQAPPNDNFVMLDTNMGPAVQPFVVVQTHHPTAPQHMVVADRNRVLVTNNGGTAFFNPGTPAFGGGSGSALTFSADGRHLWVGTTNGGVFRADYPAAIPAPPAPPPGLAWTALALPFPAVANNPWVARIAVHPADANYVAVATAGNRTAAGTQGRVFLTLDQGVNWADITGLVPVGAPIGGAPLQSLPPCPMASLAFDPSTPAGSPQVLFCGTMVGVYVIRNLPPRRVPAAAAAVPAFNPSWFTFNNRQLPAPPAPLIAGQLPLVLINDLTCVTLPPTPGAVAGTPEAVARQKLVCSSFGRGMYECDLAAPTGGAIAGGGPRFRIYLRQYSVEDGLGYPRTLPAALNAAPAAAPAAPGPGLSGDPRMPANTVLFNMAAAFDIRIDSPPYTFFDETLDGVEFDEDLGVDVLDPGELNMIYVQVHTRGWDTVPNVVVHLFFAPAPAAPVAPAIPLPLPDLHADFWAHFADVPVLPAPAVAPVGPAAAWQRTGPPVTISNIAPSQPVVARFEWVPPEALAAAPSRVALLAVITSPSDPFPLAPPPSTVMQTLLTSARHTAMRVATVGPYVPDIFIRDGVEDRGKTGSVAYGGRSPDIIVVQGAPAEPLDVAFRDLLDRRPADRLLAGVDNLVYVRVHNRKRVPVQALVELWWVKATMPFAAADASAPPFDQTKWSQAGITGDLPPLPTQVSGVTVPPRGWATARFVWHSPPDPDPTGGADKYPVYLLIALVSAVTPGDPLPVQTDADTFENFWNFFRTARNAGNAAMRGVRWSAT